MNNTTVSRAGRTDNPYVGPRAFRTNEALYGRDKEALALFNLLMAERIALLYSPSGTGKTSLIQAKLVPQLQAKHFRVLGPMRVGLEQGTLADPAQSHARVNQYIASALQTSEAQLPVEKQLAPADLAALDLAGYLRRRYWPGKSAGTIVLIFDQFEEILTVNPNDRDGKRAFFEHIGALLREPEDAQPIWALFSMREEYIAALEQYLRPIPTRLSNTLRIDRLNADNAKLAIQEPAISKGIPFTKEALKQLVEDLSKEQVQLFGGKTETQIGNYVEPVQLQVVCYGLWNKLPENTATISPTELGLLGKDISSALGDYYDDSVTSIAAKNGVSERDLRRWIEEKLISKQGIRSHALKGEQSPEMEKAIAALEDDAHLVRSETRHNATWCELSHDRLVEPIRQANKAWLQQNETPLQHQAALWWNEHQKPELLLLGKALEEAEKCAAVQGKMEEHEELFLAACRAAQKNADEAQKNAEREKHQALRIRRAAIAACILAIIALGGLVAALIFAVQADNANETLKITNVRLKTSLGNETIAKNEAIEDRKRADENARIAHARQLAAQAITLTNEQPDLALLLSLEAIRIDNSPESRSSLFTALGRSTPQLWRYLRGHDTAVWRLASNPAGNCLASADENGTVILWNIRTGMPSGPPLTSHTGLIHSLAFNAKGDLLATIDDNGTLRLWDAEKSTLVNEYESETDPFMRVAFSPNGRLMAVGKTDGSISLYEISTPSTSKFTQRLRRELPGAGKETRALVFSADSSMLASANNKSFTIWNTATGKRLCIPPNGHADTIYSLAFSVDGKTLATGSEDMRVILWDVTDPSRPRIRLQPLSGHTDAISGVAFSPDDRVLYSASGDRSVRMWNAVTGQQIGRPLTGQASAVLSLALIDGGNALATGGMDGSIILWSLYAQQQMGIPLYGKLFPVRGIAFSPDGSKLASAGQDNSIILWDAAKQQQEGAPLVSTPAQGEDNREKWVTSIIFHTQQELLYAGSTDKSIRVWDAKLHKEIGTPMMLSKGVLSLALSHDSRFLASGDSEKNIIVWDLKTREKKYPPLAGHTDAIWSLAFNMADTILASGSNDGSVRLWDVKSGEPKGDPLLGYSGRVTSMAFNPRNGFLYTACNDEIIRWDITRSPPERRLFYKSEDKTSKISSLNFSPDGSMLAVGIGSTVIFIHPETGKALFEPAESPGSSIWCVVFDDQGKTVASGSYGGIVTLWNPRTGKRFGRFMEGHHRDVWKMALSSDGTLLAFSSSDNRVEIIQPGDDKSQIKPIQVRAEEKVTALIFNPLSSASRQLFTASTGEMGRILSWELGIEQPTSNSVASETGYLHSLAISPNGATLAAGSDEGSITLWDLSTTPPEKRSLPGFGKRADGESKPVWGLAFSKDGRLLASGSSGEFIIWDVVTGDQLATWSEEGGVGDRLFGLQFSPKGCILGVPNKRGDIVLWDVSNPRKIRERNRLRGHSGMVSSLSFSPDGETLASGSHDHTVRLWDTESGQPLSLGSMRHKEPVKGVVFSRDNKKLYSGGDDGLIMQWDVDIERLKLNAINIIGRNLTEQEWGHYLPKQDYKKTNPSPMLLEADLLRLKGKQTAAKESYREIVEMTKTSNDTSLLNTVCWMGSVDGYADTVMAACDSAVSKASPDDINNYRDTRGVARATANPPRIKEAIEDFQAFADWAAQNPKYSPYGNLRREWIRVLQEGRNPFDEKIMRQLRNETME